MEPNIKAAAAILSPSTGIVDSHRLMACLESIARKGMAMLAYGHEVTGFEPAGDGYVIDFRGPDGGMNRLKTRHVINAAGLGADKIAAMMGIDIDQEGYRIYPCKGEYFGVNASRSGMVSHLVYPPPLKDLKGLGIHVTKSLDGNIRLGPNAFYVSEIDYDVEPEHKDAFYQAAKKYLPFLERSDISPDMAGIRPKLQGPGDAVKDFLIRHEAGRGLPGVLNLVGIESPGLTSCLSIAGYACDMLDGR
jgi:L-2-hydroxyglutarate oxidase LhgO